MKRARAFSMGRLVLSFVFGLATLAAAVPASAGDAAGSLRVFAPNSEVDATRYGHHAAFIDPGVFVAAVDNTFDLRVGRKNYGQPITATQAIHNADGSITFRPLPAGSLDGLFGLADFFQVTIRDDQGTKYLQKTMPFCPNSYEPQRVSDQGPDTPSFPFDCGANPFVLATVWGIDRDWAVNPFIYGGLKFSGPDGHYQVTVRMLDTYAAFFGIAPDQTSATVGVTLTTSDKPGCPPNCTCPPNCRSQAQPGPTGPALSPEDVPTLTAPDPSVMPDLVPLPSWGIGVEHRGSRDQVAFGANVWVGGSSLLDVEGFREPDSTVMRAYQYFYKDGQVVGKAPAGTMEFDTRNGHNHWHFEQFAEYRLLDASRVKVVRSHKQGFCILPTDAIDLNLPGAEWRPAFYGGGLSSSCGTETSIWVRESLPIGWGDTYYQSVAGQAFDVTDLPNGTYYIEVMANPLGKLHETNTNNNVSYRKIFLRGRQGARTVVVPPYRGIDTEGLCPPVCG